MRNLTSDNPACAARNAPESLPPSPLKILTSQQRNSTQTTYIVKADIEKRPIFVYIYIYIYISAIAAENTYKSAPQLNTNDLHYEIRHRKETTKDLLVQK